MQSKHTHIHAGILPVSIDLLEQLLCLPEGYRVTGINFNPMWRTMDFTLVADTLPEVPEYCELPRLTLRATLETLPDQDPAFRKIVTEVIVQ